MKPRSNRYHVRFSRPRAKMIFAANPVVAIHHGKPTLMVRIGNGRAAVLADAKAQLNVLLTETTTEGKVFHRAQELQLGRAHIQFFRSSGPSCMCWTNGAR